MKITNSGDGCERNYVKSDSTLMQGKYSREMRLKGKMLYILQKFGEPEGKLGAMNRKPDGNLHGGRRGGTAIIYSLWNRSKSGSSAGRNYLDATLGVHHEGREARSLPNAFLCLSLRRCLFRRPLVYCTHHVHPHVRTQKTGMRQQGDTPLNTRAAPLL